MSDERAEQITRILNESTDDTIEQLLPLVYSELRAIAERRMQAERPGQTLQATALVHEAFLRLLGDSAGFENRRHFFSAAAEAMRRILIERARRRSRVRHGGEWRRTIVATRELEAADGEPDRLLDIDAALAKLEASDEQMAMVVKLRYFAGMSIEEVADSLDISTRSVNRYWTAARAWLGRELSDRDASP
jgi:RNA polymerase sigma factor (TIGR02999 family)